jgi:hypothetical protein
VRNNSLTGADINQATLGNVQHAQNASHANDASVLQGYEFGSTQNAIARTTRNYRALSLGSTDQTLLVVILPGGSQMGAVYANCASDHTDLYYRTSGSEQIVWMDNGGNDAAFRDLFVGNPGDDTFHSGDNPAVDTSGEIVTWHISGVAGMATTATVIAASRRSAGGCVMSAQAFASNT